MALPMNKCHFEIAYLCLKFKVNFLLLCFHLKVLCPLIFYLFFCADLVIFSDKLIEVFIFSDFSKNFLLTFTSISRNGFDIHEFFVALNNKQQDIWFPIDIEKSDLDIYEHCCNFGYFLLDLLYLPKKILTFEKMLVFFIFVLKYFVVNPYLR